MISIPIWLFVIYNISLSLFLIRVLFLLIYLIAGIHDLIVSDKVASGKYDKCPYFIESKEKGGANEESY